MSKKRERGKEREGEERRQEGRRGEGRKGGEERGEENNTNSVVGWSCVVAVINHSNQSSSCM